MFTESVVSRYWKYVVKGKDCWSWTASKNHGYGQLSNGKGKSPVKAHRVSWYIHNGPIPSGLNVCHRCDNPECTNPKHLFLGTQKENMTDAYIKGRIDNFKHGEGEESSSATLSNSQVAELREEYKNGKTIKELSIKYRNTNIVRILRNKAYYNPNYSPINGNKKPRPFRKKLSAAQVDEIMESKLSSRSLAKDMGVSKTTILLVRKGEY